MSPRRVGAAPSRSSKPREAIGPEAAPRLVRKVLPRPLFEAFRFYVRQLVATSQLTYEEWGKRWIRHDDPFAVLLHERLTPFVSRKVGRPVKKSYVFLACYGDRGGVPRHLDREQCRYTLDLCVEASGEPWPLLIQGTPYTPRENEAILYLGTKLAHWRRAKPPGVVAHLAFFHFVDADFDGPLC